jgi:hypothetical protein
MHAGWLGPLRVLIGARNIVARRSLTTTSERLLGRLFRINDKVCPRCVEYLRPR